MLIHFDFLNYSFLISSFWGSSKYFNFMVNHCHEINYQDRKFFFFDEGRTRSVAFDWQATCQVPGYQYYSDFKGFTTKESPGFQFIYLYSGITETDVSSRNEVYFSRNTFKTPLNFFGSAKINHFSCNHFKFYIYII